MINVGGLDRAFRFLLGAALLLAVFVPQLALFESWGPWRYVVAAVGIMMLATAALRICPAYLPFGIKTCRTQ